MSRTKGAKNKHPTLDARLTVRLPQKLLTELDKVAKSHLQNRSEAVEDAIREYVRRG